VKYLTVFIVAVLALALAAAVSGCKKKAEPPTAETVAETAAETVAKKEVKCPAPGEDLICEECQTLFMTDKEYAAHMESKHPEEWAKIKDEFWEARKAEGAK
jgi:RNase P subunit RPR2